jgi:hypothetical protein
MTIRFAAAGSGECAVVARVLTRRRLTAPANDTETGIARDSLLRSTLRHFAAYGLQAAERAREEAESAFFAGDRKGYHHWMAICRTLDRRMADRALGQPVAQLGRS